MRYKKTYSNPIEKLNALLDADEEAISIEFFHQERIREINEDLGLNPTVLVNWIKEKFEEPVSNLFKKLDNDGDDIEHLSADEIENIPKELVLDRLNHLSIDGSLILQSIENNLIEKQNPKDYASVSCVASDPENVRGNPRPEKSVPTVSHNSASEGMLTQRQHQLLKFIQDYLDQHGMPPSFEDMRSALKLKSKSGIHRLITGLEERGYIRRLAYRARALEVMRLPSSLQKAACGEVVTTTITGPNNVVSGRFGRGPNRPGIGDGDGSFVNLPLYGQIAAGTPISAFRDHSTQVTVPLHMMQSGDHYALEVAGDSMIDVGIYDGDIVIIQRSEAAKNGEIVVALIDDEEVTLKQLYRKGATVALKAANPAYETRIFGPYRVKVQGRLVGLMRQY